MPPLGPQTNFPRKPVRKLRLPKIGPLESKGLFEEYPYAFLAIIFAVVGVLGKAGGMSGYNSLVTGLWVAACAWFAWQLRRYLKQRSSPEPAKRPKEPAKPRVQAAKGSTPAGLKPMIGPQWPLKTTQKLPPEPDEPTSPGEKPAFVYERPTLPNRKPKLPANWPKQKGKKPKR
jgi:hypothetical protein